MIMTKPVSVSVCAFGLIVTSGCAVQEKKEAAAAQAMPIDAHAPVIAGTEQREGLDCSKGPMVSR